MPGSGDHDTRPDWPIRHALDRLLAQDSWEKPYVDAACESLDALAARVAALEHAADEERLTKSIFESIVRRYGGTRSEETEAQARQIARDALAKADNDE